VVQSAELALLALEELLPAVVANAASRAVRAIRSARIRLLASLPILMSSIAAALARNVLLQTSPTRNAFNLLASTIAFPVTVTLAVHVFQLTLTLTIAVLLAKSVLRLHPMERQLVAHLLVVSLALHLINPQMANVCSALPKLLHHKRRNVQRTSLFAQSVKLPALSLELLLSPSLYSTMSLIFTLPNCKKAMVMNVSILPSLLNRAVDARVEAKAWIAQRLPIPWA